MNDISYLGKRRGLGVYKVINNDGIDGCKILHILQQVYKTLEENVEAHSKSHIINVKHNFDLNYM